MFEEKNNNLIGKRMPRAIGGQKGYTLIEIVMVIVILGVIGAFTFQFVAHGVQAFKKSSARKDLYDQGRLALERMVRELRDTKEVTDSSGSSVTFKKAHPAQAADNIEEIKFELVGTDLRRVGDPNGTPATAVLASNVTSFQIGGAGCCSVVTVDNTSSGSTDGGSSITISHATSGTNRLMLVGVSFNNDNNETVTSVTYNGVALTLKGTETNSDDARVEIWSLVAPDTGTYNVVITFSAALAQEGVAGVMTFNGVDQSTPLGSFYSVQGDDTATASLDITSTEGEFVYGVIAAEYDALTAGTGVDEQWNMSVDGTSTNGAGGTTNCGAATVPMSWSLVAEASPNNHWAIGGVSIKPTATVSETITYDAVSTGTASWTTTETFSHSIGSGSNRILVVGVSFEDCDDYPSVTWITYNGQPLTLIDSGQVISGNGCGGRAELWYLLEADLPSTGAYNVVIGTSGTFDELVAGAISLENVAQQAPEASNSNSNDAQTTISTNITTLTDGAWLVDVVHSGNETGDFVPSGGQTQRYQQVSGSSTGAASSKEVSTAGSTSAGWTSAGANRLAHVVAAFAPAGVAATCTSTVGDLVTLQITLRDPNDSDNEVTMRTKVYLRNLP
jgi:prepilin-type N-terminal cleavage/methylation domain-containing protein